MISGVSGSHAPFDVAFSLPCPPVIVLVSALDLMAAGRRAPQERRWLAFHRFQILGGENASSNPLSGEGQGVRLAFGQPDPFSASILRCWTPRSGSVNLRARTSRKFA